MGAAYLAAASVLLATAGSVAAQFDYASLTNMNSLQSGDATFYGAGQDNQGTCSFSANFANTNDLPWTTGTALTLALNDNQFADSAACGLCVMYRGTGAGLGTTPVPATWTMGFVNNRCPECSKGDLDQATSGDGRWKVEWYAVPCNVGSSSLVYSVVVSSYYWFSLVVSNTRTPITSVSVQIGGSWLPLKRSNNNQWAYYNTNGPWQSSFPMPIRVTNVLGETVSDSITGPTGNSGTVQFSASGSGGGTPATPVTTGNTSSGLGSPPTQGITGSTPPYGLTTPPTAGSPPVLPSIPPAAPPAITNPPPATPSAPPTPLGAGGFYIENYQQCGGAGGSCNTNPYTAAPCADAKWATATCRSSNFGCVRYDSTLWTCLPGAATPPSGASTQAGPPPQVAATPPPASPTIPPPTTVSTATPPAAASAGNSNAALQSSQSLAGSSPPPTPAASQPPPFSQSQTPPPAQSPPVLQAPPATQTPSATQQSPPTPTPTSTASSGGSSTGGRSFVIVSGGQCGGTTQCSPPGEATDKVTCNNGPWAGAVCSDGTTCSPAGAGVWVCQAGGGAVATGGRRLLSS